MKNESDVRKQFKKVKYHYLKKELESKMSRSPCNCKYNYVHSGTEYVYETVGQKPVQKTFEIGLCMYGSEDFTSWQGTICDTDDMAKSCPLFENVFDKHNLKQDFEESLEDDQILSSRFKDLAALKWALEESKVTTLPLTSWQLLKARVYVNLVIFQVWCVQAGLM
jgi:hypothetical protein